MVDLKPYTLLYIGVTVGLGLLPLGVATGGIFTSSRII